MDLRRTKTVLLATLPLLAFSFGSAYCFDNARFYASSPTSSDAQKPSVDQISLMTEDDFVLRSSGIVAKSADKNVMNIGSTFANAKAVANAAPLMGSDNLVSSKKLNTIYSYSAELAADVAKCGQSPMTPSEIEKLVGETAEAHGVDPGFAKAIAWTESRFDQIRNSPKGARGPMQLMPETAAGLGVRDPCDPATNIDGGVRHLRALIDEFKNPLVAAAAYNAGSRAVYDNGGIPPYGETIRYVAAVINHQLGLQLRPPERGAHEAITTNKVPLFDEQASDLIGARGGQFVNGVMHF